MNDDDLFRLKIGVIVGGALLLVIGLYAVITYRKEQHETVTEISWSRAIDIQTWMTVQESDWYIPATGREVRHYRAIHHYEDVWVGSHEECSGTGEDRRCETVDDYEREPVYRTKYDYLIDRWTTTSTPERHGTTHEATWPDVSDLRTHDVLQLGDQREGTHHSRYTITFTNGHRLDVTEDRWRKVHVGEKRVIILNIFGHALDFKDGW